ncbi:MAG: LamG domain-containing protein [Sedimentisphaerales bacterium]|nr:LamG domain-containing protein [Sedimentisphaerales bacterium]
MVTKFLDGVSSKAIHLIGSGHTGLNGGHVLLPFIALNEYPAFTVSLWVNHQGHTSIHGEGFIRYGGTIDPTGIGQHVSIQYQIPSGSTVENSHLSFSVGGHTPAGYTGGSVSMVYTSDFIKNWQHLVLRADNGLLTGFVNGQSIGTDYYTLNPMERQDAGLGVSFFNSGGTTSNRFIGMIDDVRIYNRALDQSEISELYNFNPVPVPGAFLLGSLGLAFSGWKLRRRGAI